MTALGTCLPYASLTRHLRSLLGTCFLSRKSLIYILKQLKKCVVLLQQPDLRSVLHIMPNVRPKQGYLAADICHIEIEREIIMCEWPLAMSKNASDIFVISCISYAWIKCPKKSHAFIRSCCCSARQSWHTRSLMSKFIRDLFTNSASLSVTNTDCVDWRGMMTVKVIQQKYELTCPLWKDT